MTAPLSDFALESMFTRARKTMELGPALRFVLGELDRIRCSAVPAIVTAVVDEVAPRFETTREMLLGRSRRRMHARPRIVAWWLLHYRFNMAFEKIGDAFGGRDHSTVSVQVAALQLEMAAGGAVVDLVAGVEAAVLGQLAGKRAA